MQKYKISVLSPNPDAPGKIGQEISGIGYNAIIGICADVMDNFEEEGDKKEPFVSIEITPDDS